MICKGSIDPAKLPPSPGAARFHGLQAHFQIITWKLLDDDPVQLKPEEWGDYEPETTDEVVAPDTMLQIVQCKCQSKTDHCAAKHGPMNRCPCTKHGPKCTATC